MNIDLPNIKSNCRKTLSRLRRFHREYSKNRSAEISLYIVCLLVFVAVTVQYWGIPSPHQMHLDRPDTWFKPPSWPAILGADQFGRDFFSRMVWATRVSLSIGFMSAIISMIIGTLIGAISGYYGGRIDQFFMRLTEGFRSIPSLFLILLVVAIYGSGIWKVMVVIGVTIWPTTARLVRAEFLSLRESQFVAAARTVGASDFHIIFREILPNALFAAIVTTSLRIASAIIMESTLSFLGMGDPLNLSWGLLLNQALSYYRDAWWLAVFPGLAISITVIAFNLVGDGLNDALNPHLRGR